MAKPATKKRKILSAWFRKHPRAAGVNRPRYTEAYFEPYTIAIGSLLLAWNSLHEQLARLFIMALGIEQFAQTNAIWHKQIRDYAKRELLRTAIDNIRSDLLRGRGVEVVNEVVWILDAANALEGFRDDSAHTPLKYDSTPNILTLTDILLNPGVFGPMMVYPDTTLQNPKAVRLNKTNRDLLIEYRYARERCLVLRDYAVAIDHAWADPRATWPDRPDLPNRMPNRRKTPKVSHQSQK
jgi:hypothetical protein